MTEIVCCVLFLPIAIAIILACWRLDDRHINDPFAPEVPPEEMGGGEG